MKCFNIIKKVRDIIAVCFGLLILIVSVAGISAYLTDGDKATNTFTVGGNRVDIVEDFEPPEKIEPGVEFKKDVSVKNTGSVDCFVRIKVSFTDSDMEKYSTLDINTKDYEYNASDGYYYLKDVLEVGKQSPSLFTKVKMSDDLPESEIKDFDIIIYVETYQAADHDDYGDAWEYYQRNEGSPNRLKSLRVTWSGDEEVARNTPIDKDLLEVVAVYRDGSTKVLTEADWSFGKGVESGLFPDISGDYMVPIIYSEKGVKKIGTFDVMVYDPNRKIIRLDASVKDEFATIEPGTPLGSYMYDVTAVYNDGSTKVLASSSIIKTPGYPEQYAISKSDYDNGDNVLTWEKQIPGVSGYKFVVNADSYLGYHPFNDFLYIRNNKGIVDRLSGGFDNLLGLEVTSSGDYIRIDLYANGYYSGRNLSAIIIPLDENGNEYSEFIFSPTSAPNEEGLFDVNISLNPELYDEEVSTTVHMEAKAPDPILMTGSKFYPTIPSAATSVIFTDEQVPEGYTFKDGTVATTANTYIDVSAESNGSVVAWYDSSNTTYYVSSQKQGKRVFANPDSSKMFYSKSNLTNIDLTYIDTSNVTNMSNMFSGCSKLESLDVSNFDTSDVTTMYQMFLGCSKIASLDLSNFDTSNVTNMEGMFITCSNLATLNVGSFDTSNVTTMSRMLAGCKFTTLDLSSFDTSKVTTMASMFTSSSNLTTLDLSNFDTSNVTNMYAMFASCSGLTTLKLSNFDTSNVTNMSSMFYRCSNLATLDVSNFDTSNVTNMSGIFESCSKLTTLNLSNFDTSNVTTMGNMFNRCSNLSSLDLSNFDTSKVTNMSLMFGYCMNLEELDVSGFDTSNVTNMSSMFGYCEGLTELDVRGFDTSNVTNMYCMFGSCRGLTELNLSSFDTSNVTNMNSMFSCCGGLTELNLSSFDTSKVISMNGMFEYCNKLTELDLSSFDTSNVTNMNSMFEYCNAVIDGQAYAKTQNDADRLNASSNKPTTWSFTVKE